MDACKNGRFGIVPKIVPVREVSERPFYCVGLRVTIPLRDRYGTVAGDPRQSKSIATVLRESSERRMTKAGTQPSLGCRVNSGEL